MERHRTRWRDANRGRHMWDKMSQGAIEIQRIMSKMKECERMRERERKGDGGRLRYDPKKGTGIRRIFERDEHKRAIVQKLREEEGIDSEIGLKAKVTKSPHRKRGNGE